MEPVRSIDDAGSGYLAIYAERSERRPHRCEAKGDKQYYKRVGSSSYAMEHYDIEDAFKRQERVKLTAAYTLAYGTRHLTAGQLTAIEIHLLFHLENISSMTARFPYFHILSSNQRLRPDNPPIRLGFPQISDGSIDRSTILYEGGADDVIHPGISRIACRLILPIGSIEKRKPLIDSDIPTLDIGYRAGCENSPAIYGSMTITRGELMNVIYGLSGA